MSSVKGVAPGFLLLPAKEYEWELVRKVQIDLPNEGSLQQLVNFTSPEAGLSFPGEDEFCLSEDGLILLWQTVQVLFAANKYPELKDDECLNVVGLQHSKGKMTLFGEIIRSL